ncbi:MAG: hypothetical protein OT477_10635 [Chloroflexi bacterium]|nr:hypothetical protein [Chloroflexota bacterium]
MVIKNGRLQVQNGRSSSIKSPMRAHQSQRRFAGVCVQQHMKTKTAISFSVLLRQRAHLL